MNRYRTGTFLTIVKTSVLSIMLFVCGGVYSAPPHPDLLSGDNAAKISQSYFLNNYDELHQKGVCAEFNPYVKDEKPFSVSMKSVADGSFKILALLVEFSDHPQSVPAIFFDSLIFDSAGQTIHDYYSEISYGQLDLVTLNLPSSTGWLTAPETYAYYVDGQNGTGNYPRNTQKLVEDLVDMADAVVDFSEYDNNSDGLVDMLMVIHSGIGAEYAGGAADEIWSHKYAIAPRSVDGVNVSSYTIQPEFWSVPGDMTIGVYAHELGHAFGLPDLYDTDYTSNGIGRFGLMAFGAWNGLSGMGESPAHPSAWSRIQMGFAEPVNVTESMMQVDIDDAGQGGAIYRLWDQNLNPDEYFLLENRGGFGYDASIPGQGLLIWHIDDNIQGNRYESYPGGSGNGHFQVALVQADGLYELERKQSYGDTGDPYPGSYLRDSFISNYQSPAYDSSTNSIAIESITKIGNIISADMIVDPASLGASGPAALPQTVTLNQNYPNPFNPATVIEYNVEYQTKVTVEIFNSVGQRVKLLYDGLAAAGSNSIVWSGQNDQDETVASGLYIYRITDGKITKAKKMVLLR